MKEIKTYSSPSRAAIKASEHIFLSPIGAIAIPWRTLGSPLFAIESHVDSRDSFETLRRGEQLLAERRYPDARRAFLDALHHQGWTVTV
jgi:hypothetical protein